MHKLTFTPASYTGWGCLSQLLLEVKKFNAHNILIVTDPLLKEIGLTDNVEKPLIEKGYTTTIYTDIAPEPPLAIGEKLVDFTRKHPFDLVIGVGGGSALDLAKLAAVLAKHDGKVADYLNLTGTKTLDNKGLPKILIPTTSGTGSEVTNISVLSLDTTKDVVTHDYLLADVAIVDPALTISLPSKVTAATGVDALTHAIEAYVSVNANAVTDALALQAIRLISQSIRTAVHNGQDKQARTDMSYGSYLAGLAFFNAGVAGVHALAYPLGGQFHIAHGDSNAVLLPYVMGYIRQSCEKRMKDILDAMGISSSYLSQEEASYKCVDALQQLVQDVKIPSTLQGFNIPASALEQLTEDATKQTRILARSPMPLEREDIYQIYQAAFDGVVREP
ncbi:iron-containing alcohol dehydrogenase [Lysinibacillus sp. HST-98]|uniref:Iron-containing alcohol dehydrogenase n=1 Tax=Lysinibacillus capsici TaxID=2115968 RepID=A0ABY8KL04_9BACI|nr:MULTISPECIES: iron-containing alcohol dehydrogenase [Lysinibacillus]WHP42349.1 iron-containing alcohol dehydrogenase [Lysinibacillus boronitolerans]KMN40113.1 alcohol dehydrogenase [Lysinibacillus sp. LK3]MBL3728294.1 iron-containing alcohol dehydrogenase [Lysinibacillus sp. HST-98]MCS5501551.1 iron-containing alcohol dehydrogenase [Lysinibacillus sp. A4]MDP1392546.1 iron-containing alcohol dehydrogenase [Lysinibacillus capsici]